MKTRLYNLWTFLKAGYIFVPMAISMGAVALSAATIRLEPYVGQSIGPIGVYSGTTEGARLILTTIASSVITVAGVVFSITILVLALTSSQYGARLLRNFLRDPVTQSVLGALSGTFIYCMIILKEVRETGGEVPGFSVSVGVYLAVGSIFLLIYFFHHIASLIQPENICHAVFRDLESVIDEFMPTAGEVVASGEPNESAMIGWNAPTVNSGRSGYIESIELGKLVKEAERHGVILRVAHRAGDFIVKGEPLCEVWPRERMNQRLQRKVERSFILGAKLTLEQDVEFAFSQLVQVAVRALSPGINDPYTAMTCVDWLGVALSSVATREAPLKYMYGSDGKLRVIADVVNFAGITDTAFNQIRQAAKNNVAVSIRLLETIKVVAGFARTHEQRKALLTHAEKIRREIGRAGIDMNDMADVEERFRAAVETLKAA